MEFFRIIDKQVTEEIIQNKITPENLELFTESMFLLEKVKNNFSGATLWGGFLISYDQIKGGIRFALLDCPNALQWTITTGFSPERTKILIHATINRTQKPLDFIKEVNEFLDEWETGLTTQF
ncbi:hypothetical protein SAMN06265371_102261 [Lutibacter agarilyticus]|uniref:Uncharacterized protein n=1 Tax=Lutibacter agarilyticus TaxID=1109740 RepID=A0A238VZ11_9FLAO|nr:hypothetical protein [Lutibacter agarilyticus]SNR39496.1 hypothetical protein SAMN06265371_102261 [Lutibacter agarilyticus]